MADVNDWQEVPLTDEANDWEEVPVEAPSAVQSALAGLAQGLTFGHADEIIGGAQALGAKLTGDERELGDLYRQYRDERRSLYEDTKRTNPITYQASELGGAIAPALLTGGAAAPASVGQAAARSGVMGALGGGAMAAGSSEADLTQGDVSGFAKDVAEGAALGGVTGAATGSLFGLANKYLAAQGAQEPAQEFAESAVESTGKIAAAGGSRAPQSVGETALEETLEPVFKETQQAPSVGEAVRSWLDQRKLGAADSVKTFAERRAAKAAIGNQAKYMDDLVRRGKLESFGRDLIDEGVVAGAPKAETIAQRAAAAKSSAGDEIGALLSGLDSQASGSSLASAIREYAESIRSPNNSSIYSNLLKQADEFEGMGDIPLGELQRLKNQYRWSMGDPTTMSLGKDATNRMKTILGTELDEAVARSGDDTASGAYEALKAKYGSFATAAKSAEKLASRQEKNRTFGLTDYLAGGAAYGGLGPAGLIATPANKFLRERGSSLAAVGADKLQTIIRQNPSKLGRYAETLLNAAEKSPEALGASHFILWKNNPDYRKMWNEGLAEVADSL